jgi:uncharacterized protein
MTDTRNDGTRSARLDRAIRELLTETQELEAVAIVSFDGLPMASAMPPDMDEDRVAAMSAALLSLGERASEGLGKGELSQVYIEGEEGTVFLVSAENEAVVVAVAAKGAKVGLMLYEVKRTAVKIAHILRRPEVETESGFDSALEALVSMSPTDNGTSALQDGSGWSAPAPEPSLDMNGADAGAGYYGTPSPETTGSSWA